MFGIYQGRRTYWSHSKIAAIILKHYSIVRPSSATSEDWETWENNLKSTHPKINWIVEELFDSLQDVLFLPYDIFKTIENYILNRWVSKTHGVNTHLKKGVWHEANERMLHSMFTILVDFIECDKAGMQIICADDKPKFTWLKFVRRCSRYPELGLKYLDWEINLSSVDDYDGVSNKAPSLSAKEQLLLYNWWVNERPKRLDPYDIVDIDTMIKDSSLFPFKFTAETRNMYSRITEIEQEYEAEDTAMLIRLIKIRDNLWV